MEDNNSGEDSGCEAIGLEPSRTKELRLTTICEVPNGDDGLSAGVLEPPGELVPRTFEAIEIIADENSILDAELDPEEDSDGETVIVIYEYVVLLNHDEGTGQSLLVNVTVMIS